MSTINKCLQAINEQFVGKRCIVRFYSAGVFCGTILEISYDPRIILLKDSRRLWSWSGAASLSELTMKGVANPQNCKFPISIDEHVGADWIEIMPVTPESEKIIDSIKPWGYVS